MTERTNEAAVKQALNTPLLSEERRALDEKWAGHLHHDGTIYPTITSACRFGSVLRDDVCHPRLTSPPAHPNPEPPTGDGGREGVGRRG